MSSGASWMTRSITSYGKYKTAESSAERQTRLAKDIQTEEGILAGTEFYLGEMKDLDAQFAAEMKEMASSMEAADVYVEAGRTGKENDRAIRGIQLQYRMNGVEMSGSPLLVMEKARKDSEMELEAMETRAENILKYGKFEATQMRMRGKAELTRGRLIGEARIRAAKLDYRSRKRLIHEEKMASWTDFMGEFSSFA